jgi:hypothetical protein
MNHRVHGGHGEEQKSNAVGWVESGETHRLVQINGGSHETQPTLQLCCSSSVFSVSSVLKYNA